MRVLEEGRKKTKLKFFNNKKEMVSEFLSRKVLFPQKEKGVSPRRGRQRERQRERDDTTFFL